MYNIMYAHDDAESEDQDCIVIEKIWPVIVTLTIYLLAGNSLQFSHND